MQQSPLQNANGFHSYPPTATLPTHKRTAFWLCVILLTLALLIILDSGNDVYARGSRGRRDRRPDREVPIRYSRSSSTTNQTGRPSLQRATVSQPSISPASTSEPTNSTESTGTVD